MLASINVTAAAAPLDYVTIYRHPVSTNSGF